MTRGFTKVSRWSCLLRNSITFANLSVPRICPWRRINFNIPIEKLIIEKESLKWHKIISGKIKAAYWIKMSHHDIYYFLKFIVEIIQDIRKSFNSHHKASFNILFIILWNFIHYNSQKLFLSSHCTHPMRL